MHPIYSNKTNLHSLLANPILIKFIRMKNKYFSHKVFRLKSNIEQGVDPMADGLVFILKVYFLIK